MCIHIYIYYIYIYVCVCVSVCVSMCVCACKYIHLSIYLSIDLSIDLSIYRSIDLSIYRYIDPSIYRSVDLSIYRSIDPSIYRSIDLSIYLSLYIYIYIYLFIYLRGFRQGGAPLLAKMVNITQTSRFGVWYIPRTTEAAKIIYVWLKINFWRGPLKRSFFDEMEVVDFGLFQQIVMFWVEWDSLSSTGVGGDFATWRTHNSCVQLENLYQKVTNETA